MAPSATALLVLPPGPGRRSAAGALRAAGLRVRKAREPYDATARFVEGPTDLVVLSLARFRPQDTAFLRTVRERSPTTRILLLVPADRRRLAVRALEAGADAFVVEPCYPEELAAVASRLLARRHEGISGAPPPDALPRLAGEVAHAVNNPLQVLSLLGEAGSLPAAAAQSLRGEVGRVRDVVGILDRFAGLGPPARVRVPVGVALRASLEEAEALGRVRAVGRPVPEGPEARVDPAQVRTALGSLLHLLSARGPARPLPVAARVRRAREAGGTVVEAAVRARGVRIAAPEVQALRGSVLLSDERTRLPYPGLALAEEVGRLHGGRLLASDSESGTVLALRLPP